MNIKYRLLILTLFISFLINAQVTTVISGGSLEDPNRFLLIGDELYFSEDDRISKINLTDVSPTRVTVVDGLNNPGGMALKGNDLYIADFFNGRIVKIDITIATPSIAVLPNTYGSPNMLLFNNDDLYVTDNQDDVLRVYDTSVSNASFQTVASQFVGNGGPIGIELKDDFLYVTAVGFAPFEGKLYKININNPVPIELLSGLDRPLGIEFRDDDLYIALSDSDKIVKVDITQNPLVVEDVVDINNPSDITFYSDIMYIAQPANNRISKVDLNSLDINEYDDLNSLKLSPNPAKDNITISNLKEDKTYKLFDINGRVLKSGKLEMSDNNINVTDLASGTYIIRIEDSNFKFIKI